MNQNASQHIKMTKLYDLFVFHVCVLNIYPPLPSIWGLVHLCQNAQYGTLKMFPLAKTQIWKGFCSSLASSVNWRGPYETSLCKYFVCLCVWQCVCVWLMWKSVVCLTVRNDKRMHFGLLEGNNCLIQHKIKCKCYLIFFLWRWVSSAGLDTLPETEKERAGTEGQKRSSLILASAYDWINM